MRAAQIHKQVLTRCKPSKLEEQVLEEAIAIFVSELEAALAYTKNSAQVFVGGSAAKGTWLKGNHDIDVFVRFAKTTKDISDVLENVLALLPDAKYIERVHGSRDYFQLERGMFSFEIVPVLNITNASAAQNVTDMSPLHVVHIEKHLSKKQHDEVRLLKQFAKAQRCYGAESYINGFSGHVLELLVLEYKTFQNVLAAACSWERPVVIDTQKHHKNPLAQLNAAKVQCPLILIDPVQPERNAAAALSQEVFGRFIIAAKKYCTVPRTSMFAEKTMTLAQLHKRFATNAKACVIEMHALQGKRDVVGTKCLKAFLYLTKQLEGFVVKKSDFFFNDTTNIALCYVVVDIEQLPKTFVQQGPPLSQKKDVQAFTKKHVAKGHSVFEKQQRLFAHVPYTHRTLKKQIKGLVNTTYVQTKIKKVKLYA